MSDYDGLRGCEQCGNDTTDRLCNSCRTQEMIDNDDMAGFAPYVPLYSEMVISPGCEECDGVDFKFIGYTEPDPELPPMAVYKCNSCGKEKRYIRGF